MDEPLTPADVIARAANPALEAWAAEKVAAVADPLRIRIDELTAQLDECRDALAECQATAATDGDTIRKLRWRVATLRAELEEIKNGP